MGTLEIRLLGTLSVERDGQPITRFQSQRVKDLLCYLLLNREILHPRDHLAGLFWGDMEEANARHCLNTALWRLQRALGQSAPGDHPHLRVDAQTIGFNTASDYRLDVAEFELYCGWAAQAGSDAPDRQARLYEQAAALYRADLLVECYEDWCLFERERMRGLYLRAIGQLLEYHSSRGEYEPAIEYGRRILVCDPLREEVHRDLIRLYLDANQPAAALRQYRACEHILVRELGVSPMPETQSFLARLMGQGLPIRLDTQSTALDSVADPAHQLASALAYLQEVTGALERARVQLHEAASLVREVAQRLGYDPSTGGGFSPPGRALDSPRPEPRRNTA